MGRGQQESEANDPVTWQLSAQKAGSDPQYPAPLQQGALSGQLPPPGANLHVPVVVKAAATLDRTRAKSGL